MDMDIYDDVDLEYDDVGLKMVDYVEHKIICMHSEPAETQLGASVHQEPVESCFPLQEDQEGDEKSEEEEGSNPPTITVDEVCTYLCFATKKNYIDTSGCVFSFK